MQSWTVFAKLGCQREGNRTTSIQRVLLQWLISKYGVLYKRVKLDVIKQMVTVSAIIDKDDLLDLGAQCEDVANTYAIGFSTVVKRTKLAAGLFTFIHLLCIMMAISDSLSLADRGLNDHHNQVREALTSQVITTFITPIRQLSHGGITYAFSRSKSAL